MARGAEKYASSTTVCTEFFLYNNIVTLSHYYYAHTVV